MAMMRGPSSSWVAEFERRAQANCYPLRVIWELTHQCNERCRHCYLAPVGRAELGTVPIMATLDQLADCGVLFATFTGGEILCRADFFEIASHARKRRFALKLLTNATLIDSDVAQRIAELDPTVVDVSLYSTDPAIHDNITRFPGSFERTVRGLENLVARGVRTVMRSPLTKVNAHQYRDLIAFAGQLGSRFVFDPTLIPRTDGCCEQLFLRPEDQDVVDLLSLSLGELASDDLASRPISRDRNANTPLCGAGNNLFSIDPYGNIHPCLMLRVSAGNVREQDFRTVWDSSPLLAEIRQIRAGQHPCWHCPQFEGCQICMGWAMIECGDPFAVLPERCRITKLCAAVQSRHRHLTGGGISAGPGVAHPNLSTERRNVNTHEQQERET